jgi:hypothetical protein
MPECVPGNPSIRVLAAELKQWGCQRVKFFLSIFMEKKKYFFGGTNPLFHGSSGWIRCQETLQVEKNSTVVV